MNSSLKTLAVQAFRYALVGVCNTMITLAAYLLLTLVFGVPPGTANPVGYVAGLVNSFIWNRQWTFGHSGAWALSAAKFAAVFAVCFAAQYAICEYLDGYLGLRHYVSFIIAMIVYNILFFLSGKYIIFKKS